MSDSMQPHRLQHDRLPCPSPSLGVCSKSRPLSWRSYLTTSSSVATLSFCSVCVCVCVWERERERERELLSRDCLFVTSMTVACQAPLSMGLSRQEYWSGLPLPSSGDLRNPGIEPWSPALQTDPLLSEPPGKPSPFASDAFFPWHVSHLPFC